jgi:hypothetical protein
VVVVVGAVEALVPLPEAVVVAPTAAADPTAAIISGLGMAPVGSEKGESEEEERHALPTGGLTGVGGAGGGIVHSNGCPIIDPLRRLRSSGRCWARRVDVLHERRAMITEAAPATKPQRKKERQCVCVW